MAETKSPIPINSGMSRDSLGCAEEKIKKLLLAIYAEKIVYREES